MNQYINAIKLLNYLAYRGTKWENIGTTPDNEKNNLLSKYQLTKPYVDGVYDAMNKRGQYKNVNDFLKGLGQDWNNLGEKYKKELLTGKELDIDYVNGIADAIKNEKSKHADSDRYSGEQL